MNCILCEGTRLFSKCKLSRQSLIKLYEKKFKIDVMRLIPEDLSVFQCEDCDLIFFDPQSTGDERFYNEFQSLEWYYESDKQEFRWAKSRIPARASVLEVGAGSGAFAAHIPECIYTGLDFSSGAKTLAKTRGVDIHTVSIEEWADDNPEAYDVVCHFQVLEHVAKPGSFLRACAKALKPGGILLVSVPSEDSYLGLMYNDALNMPPHHISRWTDRALIAAGNVIHCHIDELNHDVISSTHRNRLVSAALSHLWMGTPPMLDLRLSTRLKMAAVRRIAGLLGLDTINERFLGYGNNVNVVYSKK